MTNTVHFYPLARAAPVLCLLINWFVHPQSLLRTHNYITLIHHHGHYGLVPRPPYRYRPIASYRYKGLYS